MQQADRSCSNDDDCTIAQNRVSCFADCGVAEAIARSAIESVDVAVQYVEGSFCRVVEDANCPPQPVPPCAPAPERAPVADCIEGVCTLVYLESEPL
jgi:hypothetical protein